MHLKLLEERNDAVQSRGNKTPSLTFTISIHRNHKHSKFDVLPFICTRAMKRHQNIFLTTVAQDSQYFTIRCFPSTLQSGISKEEKMLKRFYILKQSVHVDQNLAMLSS